MQEIYHIFNLLGIQNCVQVIPFQYIVLITFITRMSNEKCSVFGFLSSFLKKIPDSYKNFNLVDQEINSLISKISAASPFSNTLPSKLTLP